MYTGRKSRTSYREPLSDVESDVDDGAVVESARLRPKVAAAARGSSPPPATSSDKKKKNGAKKRLPPQDTIDKLWERFAQKRFSKATTVLPFAPVAPSPLAEQANELLTTGYERAAEECRRKVRKIIQECRRVNMRYRDPGWDIDWDLKTEAANCLNSLGGDTFDFNSFNLLRTTVPKAVKRVHEIFEKPTFMNNISGSDVKQGNLGDCWLVACVSGLANVADGIQRTCVEYDTKIGIYGFVFYRDGEWIYSIVDDKLYLTSPCWDSPSFQRKLLQEIDREDVERVYRKTYQTGSKALFFAQNKDQNETWLPLMEKAYAKAHGDYESLDGGWIGEGIEDLTGGVTAELLLSDVFDTDSFWDKELSRVNEEFLFGCSTGLLDGGYGERDGIAEGHAYNIMEARTLKNGTRLLKLRNPWGKVKSSGNWQGAWSDGSKEWTAEVQEELGHSFGNDSVFWIAYDDFLIKYQHIDRTRLFRDPGWHCCQRWVGVDVPWKTQYFERFHIRLTQESPFVLVLSQLDDRYFHGLVGQYYFRLHFRLHEQSRPDAEDYVVRSHGNYLMRRAVTVELPSLLPGAYTVFLSVVAQRVGSQPAVEEVVKRELKLRGENEKLAQVGYAYDLAHSKAAAHLAALAKLRKKGDYSKASTERKTERRKAWAKRHLLKDLQKRQQAKNDAKKKRRHEEREAQRKKEKEAAEKEAAEKEAAEKEAAEKKAAEKEAAGEKAADKDTTEKKADEKDGEKETTETKEKGKEPEVSGTDEKSTSAEAGTEEKKDKAEGGSKDEEAQTEDNPQDKEVQTEPSSATPQADHEVQTDSQVTEEDKPADAVETAETGVEAVETAEAEVEAGAEVVETESLSTSSSGMSTPLDTPKSEAIPEPATDGSTERVEVPPIEVSGAPPPVTPEAESSQPGSTTEAKEESKAEEVSGEQSEDKPADKSEDKPADKSEDKPEKSEDKPEDKPAEKSESTEKADEKADGKTGDTSEDGRTDGSGQTETSDKKDEATEDKDAAAESAEKSTETGKEEQAVEEQAEESHHTNQSSRAKEEEPASEEDSSDSPIEDWEEFYSSDDLSTKLTRQTLTPSSSAPTPTPAKDEDDSEDEKDQPTPWNAICIVGIRVYSKDPALEVSIVMEGEDPAAEGGVQGEHDLDNAQSNAGGQRVKKGGDKDSDKDNVKDEDQDGDQAKENGEAKAGGDDDTGDDNKNKDKDNNDKEAKDEKDTTDNKDGKGSSNVETADNSLYWG